MERQTPSQPIHRKSYQTDSRPLADVMFAIVSGAAMGFLGSFLFVGAPISFAITISSVTTALLYKAFIDVLTVFHLPTRNALVSAVFVSTVSIWRIRDTAASDLLLMILQMPIYIIAVNHLLDGWQRKR
jgi:hypothetical protein